MRKKIGRPWQKPGNGPVPQQQKINPQVVVTLNRVTNQIETRCNFNDWDSAISMLIDALRGARDQKAATKDQSIVVASPNLVTLS